MFNTIMGRRTIRKYMDHSVERSKIDKIVKAALTAPTGKNLKPVDLVVVENKETLDKLSKVRGKASQWMKGAGVGFVLVADTSESTTWEADSAIMATIIQLAGESLGLGSCWIHIQGRVGDDGSDVESNVREILDIDEDKKILCMISMGYPDEIKSPHYEDRLNYKKVHYEKY